MEFCLQPWVATRHFLDDRTEQGDIGMAMDPNRAGMGGNGAKCYKHDKSKAMGAIGSGSTITTSRPRGAWELVRTSLESRN
jgi:hypothetical protein